MPPDVRHVPLEEARKKLGAYADALALDQRVRKCSRACAGLVADAALGGRQIFRDCSRNFAAAKNWPPDFLPQTRRHGDTEECFLKKIYSVSPCLRVETRNVVSGFSRTLGVDRSPPGVAAGRHLLELGMLPGPAMERCERSSTRSSSTATLRQ